MRFRSLGSVGRCWGGGGVASFDRFSPPLPPRFSLGLSGYRGGRLRRDRIRVLHGVLQIHIDPKGLLIFLQRDAQVDKQRCKSEGIRDKPWHLSLAILCLCLCCQSVGDKLVTPLQYVPALDRLNRLARVLMYGTVTIVHNRPRGQ